MFFAAVARRSLLVQVRRGALTLWPVAREVAIALVPGNRRREERETREDCCKRQRWDPVSRGLPACNPPQRKRLTCGFCLKDRSRGGRNRSKRDALHGIPLPSRQSERSMAESADEPRW